jgi:hypothetical protein
MFRPLYDPRRLRRLEQLRVVQPVKVHLVCQRAPSFVMRDPGELVPLLLACSALILISVVTVKSAFFTK